jgi:Uma2 family endonuclease
MRLQIAPQGCGSSFLAKARGSIADGNVANAAANHKLRAMAMTGKGPLTTAEPWPLSVKAYHALAKSALIPERTELLYGFIYPKNSKSPFHSFLVVRLIRLLQAALSSGLLLRSEQPLTCIDSEPEPDVAIVRGSEADFLNKHPHTAELVIEVCVSSHAYDRSKIRAYAKARVKECWFVLGPEKQVEIYRSPAAEQFRERIVCGPDERVTSLALPQFSVEVESLFKV